MPSKNPAQRLEDILENIAAIREFTSEVDPESFLSNKQVRYAVTRALEIISEAVKRLPDALKERHPNVNWRAIAAAGNVYRHEYDAVDDSLLWHTAKGGIDILQSVVREELDLLDRDDFV